MGPNSICDSNPSKAILGRANESLRWESTQCRQKSRVQFHSLLRSSPTRAMIRSRMKGQQKKRDPGGRLAEDLRVAELPDSSGL